MRLLALLLLLPALLQAQSPYLKKVKKTLDRMACDTALQRLNWGFCLRDLKTGEIVMQHDAHRLFTPASVQKVLTTGAAMGILGTGYRFKTELGYGKRVDAENYLFIRGEGDPTLGSWRFGKAYGTEALFKNWQDAIKAKGIEVVDFEPVYYDNSYFDQWTQPPGWSMEDVGNYYGAGASGLNFEENTYTLTLQSGQKQGDSVCVLHAGDTTLSIDLENEVVTGPANSSDQAYIYFIGSRGGMMVLKVRGTLPPKPQPQTIKGAFPWPEVYLGERFMNFLEKDGHGQSQYVLELDKKYRCESPKGELKLYKQVFERNSVNLLHTHLSPPLPDIIYHTNQRSINLYAECLLKACGKKPDKPATLADGIAAVKNYWVSKGLTAPELHLEDGSGLARGNNISPAALSGALHLISKEPWYRDFRKSLPDFPGLAGKAVAKTGYMEGVRAYAGYIGEEYSFCLIFNGVHNEKAAVKAWAAELMKKEK